MADLLATGLAVGDEGFNAHFRAEFSRMRSAMAFHQASWPVVAIDPSNARYIESIEANRQAYRRFFEWLRTTAAY